MVALSFIEGGIHPDEYREATDARKASKHLTLLCEII